MSRRIRLKSRMQELIQAFIENHGLGLKLARQQLGTTPKFLVLEHIDQMDKLGRTGILLLRVRFNSDEGAFEGSLAIKEFESNEEAQRLVDVNNWLVGRVAYNPRISVPQIFSAGGRWIVYEGIQGESFEESRLDKLVKLRLAGEALATYHAPNFAPVNEYRYQGLLWKMIDALPINQDRKDKLRSFGLSFLTYYNKNNAGVYSYGDFHPGNIMVNPEGTLAYLIDPEFIETELGADRFEDICNFLIFDAYQEFLQTERLDQTFKQLEVFLGSYNGFLGKHRVTTEEIYTGTSWLALIFHLGLVSLIKGAVVVQTVTITGSGSSERNMEEIIQSYRLTRYVWLLGAQYLPQNAFPPGVTPNVPTADGWLVTWPILADTLLSLLRQDSHFQALFNLPRGKDEISVVDAMDRWNLSDKKELERISKDLKSWFHLDMLEVGKDVVTRLPDWRQRAGLPSKFEENWELSALTLFNTWIKKPLVRLVVELTKRPVSDEKTLEKAGFLDKKELKEALTEARRIGVIACGNEILLQQTWQEQMNVPSYFNISFFGKL